MSGKDELLEGLCTAQILTRHNPCKLSDQAMSFIAKGLNTVMSKDYAKGLSQDKVAEYMGISTRTLQRWQKIYPDFPRPRHDGFHSVTYDAVEVVGWWEQNNKKLSMI